MDPYYKWLGIPPDEQPPHYYRLLGVRIFESDPEVIESAANQRMEYLQSLSGGDHPAAAQQLLSEMARARITLLEQRQRKAYNAELKATTKPVPLVPPIKTTSSQNIGPSSAMNSSKDYQGDKSNGITLPYRTSKNGNRPLLRAAIILTLVVCVLAAILLVFTSVDDATTKQDVQKKVEPHSNHNLSKDGISQSQRIGRNNTNDKIEPHLSQKGSNSIKLPAESSDGLVNSDVENSFIIGSKRIPEEQWRVTKRINGTLVKDKSHSNVVRIELTGFEIKKNVFVAGTFNNWHTDRNPMQRDGDLWFIEIPQPEIPFEFKYYIPSDPLVEKWYPEGIDNHYHLKNRKLNKEPGEDLLGDYSDATAYRIPNSELTVITFDGFWDDGNAVFLVGEYNNWSPRQDKMTRGEKGVWEITKELPRDKNEIKFFIDQGGEWHPDKDIKVDLLTTAAEKKDGEANVKTPLQANDKAFSRENAKALLVDNGLYEGKPGVWYLRVAGNPQFIQRQYGRVRKQSGVERSLQRLHARFPNLEEKTNLPPPSRR